MEVYFVDPDQERELAGHNIQAWLEKRRELGLDRRDEVWDGVYHVVPGPSSPHQHFEKLLDRILHPYLEPLGYEVYRCMDVLQPGRHNKDYRQPDISVVAPKNIVHRGIEGHAELVVEVLSPRDESRKKFGFYAAREIPEFWIADPVKKIVEVYVLRDGKYARVDANERGIVVAPRFHFELQTITTADGPKLQIRWPGGNAEI
jgi:Uma2 family endonuclease